MTSEQVPLLTAALLLITGCALFSPRGADPLLSPYPTRRVWAVAPLRNESGSTQADGWAIADHLVKQLENARHLDVLPVNRVLAAMDALKLPQVRSPNEAKQLLRTLGVDALVVGTITAYDPYDPPRLGLAIELYIDQNVEHFDSIDVRGLTRAATAVGPLPGPASVREPTSTVSAVFDAADPMVRRKLQRYAIDRGQVPDKDFWHLYRVSMDLYSEFVSYVMSWRLLRAEAQRIATPTTLEPAGS